MAKSDGQRITALMILAMAGMGSINQRNGLSLAGLDSHRREETPFQVAFEGVEYLIGANVAQYTRPIERVDFARFTEGRELRAMLYAALSQMDVGGQQVAMAIGLPVEVVEDKVQAKAIEKQMGRWLVGSHTFCVNNVEMMVEIVRIKATIAQPTGAWLDWGMDNAGKWTKGDTGRRSPALIVDQGFNTLDLFAVENSKPSTRFSGGDTLGMRRAAEMISETIANRHGISLGLHEADSLLQQHLAGETPAIYVHGELIGVVREVESSLDTLAADVLKFVDRKVGKEAGRFRIILTGGGALAIGKRLMAQYAHAEMAPQPQLANARGLAKLALTSYLD